MEDSALENVQLAATRSGRAGKLMLELQRALHRSMCNGGHHCLRSQVSRLPPVHYRSNGVAPKCTRVLHGPRTGGAGCEEKLQHTATNPINRVTTNLVLRRRPQHGATLRRPERRGLSSEGSMCDSLRLSAPGPDLREQRKHGALENVQRYAPLPHASPLRTQASPHSYPGSESSWARELATRAWRPRKPASSSCQ